VEVLENPENEIVQENHYDPWGLNLIGLEERDWQSRREQKENAWQFNAKSELETTFALHWLETPNRAYDAQTGRFWCVWVKKPATTSFVR